MPASWLIVFASLLFATMGVCVKLASLQHGSGEIVMYRAAGVARAAHLAGEALHAPGEQRREHGREDRSFKRTFFVALGPRWDGQHHRSML
jgi:hypothetical protein